MQPSPTSNRSRKGSPLTFSLPLYLAAILLTIGYGATRLHDSGPIDTNAAPDSTETANNTNVTNPADTLHVAVIQTNLPQSNKDHSTLAEYAEAFDGLLDLTRQAAEAGAKLIVWPETIVPAALNDESYAIYAASEGDLGRYRRLVAQTAVDLNIAIIAGAHAREQWTVDTVTNYYMPRDRYNSAYLIATDGSIAGRYDKVHRVPFGEYVPFIESSPSLKRLFLKLTPYESDYSLTPGTDFTILNLTHSDIPRTWRLATPICFEDVVSYVPRRMVWGEDGKQVDLLVNLSNDGWFAGTAEGPQHEQISRFRAVENRTPLVRSVNTGVSSFIDSSGRIVRRVTSPTGQTQQIAGFAVHNVRLDSRTTLFGTFGDLFAAVTLAVAFILTAYAASYRVFRRTLT